jgi:hypothetical protein
MKQNCDREKNDQIGKRTKRGGYRGKPLPHPAQDIEQTSARLIKSLWRAKASS